MRTYLESSLARAQQVYIVGAQRCGMEKARRCRGSRSTAIASCRRARRRAEGGLTERGERRPTANGGAAID